MSQVGGQVLGQMKATVIHHSADFDGLFCREIAGKFLPDAELIGWDYGDSKIPAPEEGTIYVLDLSPVCLGPSAQPEAITAPGRMLDRVIWIDHHKSAIDEYDRTIPGYRIDGVAACRLAWQWFSIGEHNAQNQTNEHLIIPLPGKQDFVDRSVSEPLAVRLAGEYDIWDKRDPDAELFQAGLRSRDLAGEWGWSKLLGDDPLEAKICVNTLLKNGEAIQYAQTQQNKSIITHAGFTVQFEGLTFLACNHARFNSHLFTAAIRPEHDALMGFCWDGKQWKFSMYHAPGKEQFDLSAIAKARGGGGHKGACGFQCATLPFSL